MDSVRKTRKTVKKPAPENRTRCAATPTDSLIDRREQLVNGGETGPIERVSQPESLITSSRGILLDFDPKWFRQGLLPKGARTDPVKFYEKFVCKMLQRHPVLARAEVRVSGQGVHGIIQFATPVVFKTEADRQRWGGIVRAIQRVLPTDPDCPGITALTRPVGSINSKNGKKVRLLFKGEPVPAEEVLALFEEVRSSPFRTVARILFGDEHITPCPICKTDGSRLDALDRAGVCYGGCGKVRLGQLYDVFLRPRPAKKGV